LATETTTVTAESSQSPVFLTNPKMGSTLQGNVDIKVGFGQQLKNSYVSFFVDNQFKSISNVPPYEFTWDTRGDSNGWHEVEAWVVDDTSATYKTRKVRVFVQNPGGRTDRPSVAEPVAKPVPPAAKPILAETTANALHVSVGGSTSTKPAALKPSISSGPKEMLPTGKRLMTMAQKPLPPTNAIHNAVAAAGTGMVSITRGARLPSVGAFAIVYNTQFVDFDVQPRVTEDGVPLTPLRYLLEKAGGKVDWQNSLKNVSAKADGHDIFLHIGDSFAEINKQRIELERPSFIDRGRTIVPLSFMKNALNVNIDYDKATGHVLITSIKK
ncbi:MAG TPA: stalk domain-containing protein, partial [Fimbriimonadaceae bacterium]|nr:stalk domain-containing protein [Fimbriimonadaceae bacterium]